MLWCTVCCEPYHSFCLQAEDLPLKQNSSVPEEHNDWICRRCALCKICGQPGESLNNLNENESERKRLKCRQCRCVFHSDCLQPSQQKLIDSQGDNWVSIFFYSLT